MPDYTLIIRQTGGGLLKPIVVTSNDATSVLALAHRHHGEYAELWTKDKLLCRMTYMKGGFWTIQGQEAITAHPAATMKTLSGNAASANNRLPIDPSQRAPRKGLPAAQGKMA